MVSCYQLRTVFQDGFADDAFAFAEEYAEFFQASRKAMKPKDRVGQACEQWKSPWWFWL